VLFKRTSRQLLTGEMSRRVGYALDQQDAASQLGPSNGGAARLTVSVQEHLTGVLAVS
jgi:hypothetical protein